MKKTDNYSLPQWEKQDFIKMEDFNDAFGKTDAALKANADATATGLNAEIAARGEAVAALSKNLGAAGHNCRVKWGTYTGTGVFGADNPTSLHCDFTPVLVIIGSPASNYGSVIPPMILFRPFAEMPFKRDGSTKVEYVYVSWNDTSVLWYTTTDVVEQFNVAKRVYSYVIFGYDKTAEDA